MSDQTKLPLQIFVIRETDGDDSFLAAYDNCDGFNNGDTVGVYEFVTSATKRVTHQLVPCDTGEDTCAKSRSAKS